MPVLVILGVLAIIVHDSFALFPLIRRASESDILVLTIGPMVSVLLVAQVFVWRCARAIDRTGHPRWARRADAGIAGARLVLVLTHLFGVLALGWLDLVRSWLGGDLVIVDESIALFPLLGALATTWLIMHPIERRLHEGVREHAALDGFALAPMASPLEYVTDQVRHHMLLVLVPIGLIGAWSEALLRVAQRTGHGHSPWLGAGQMAGVAGVVLLSPLIVRIIWRTRSLEPGETRDRLLEMCSAQRVGCRDILVWRTRGLLLNGAVIGVVGPLRYILLTDALLDRLTPRELEAVMAHEIAHARYRHLPWSMASIVACAAAAWGASWWLAQRVRIGLGAHADSAVNDAIAGLGLAVALGVSIVVFGFLSRRFEWQADAFAAKHLSGVTRRGPADPHALITPEAASAMGEALLRVAELNHTPVNKFGWRHGSIRSRVQRLGALIGHPANSLPIDRRVRLMKAACALGVLLAIAMIIRQD